MNSDKNQSNKILKPYNKKLALSLSVPSNNGDIDKNLLKKSEEDYQNSFDNIIAFSNKITAAKKKGINAIIYHADNADGLFSAYIAVQYLLENKKDDINILPLKPSSGYGIDSRLEKDMSKIEGRNLLVLDLSYNKETLVFLKTHAKSVIILDDHPRNDNAYKNSNTFFVGDDRHAAVAYTWKFFYPNEPVPLFVQVVDNDDRKLQLPFLRHLDFHSYSVFYNYRLIHNPYLNMKFDKPSDFKYIELIIDSTNMMVYNVIGHYYDEVVNNIKDQVARNARFAYFQGHPVYVLNYNDPVLYKMVARQMITNAENNNQNIDFAVLWGYEYTSGSYKVFLSEKHTRGKPRFNLPQIARTLGKIGDTKKGGGGGGFVGNFYWPRNNKKDIWDLFTKNKTFLR